MKRKIPAVKCRISSANKVDTMLNKLKAKITGGSTDYPVTVFKWVRRADNWKLKIDKGRRIKDRDTGDWKYEFKNDGGETTGISYNAIIDTKEFGDILFVAKPEQNVYLPLTPNITIQDGELRDEDGEFKSEAYTDAFDLITSLKQFKEWAEWEIENTYNVVDTADEAWYEDKTVQAAIVFISMGVFLVIAGIAYQKFVSKELLDAISALQGSAAAAAEGAVVIGGLGYPKYRRKAEKHVGNLKQRLR